MPNDDPKSSVLLVDTEGKNSAAFWVPDFKIDLLKVAVQEIQLSLLILSDKIPFVEVFYNIFSFYNSLDICHFKYLQILMGPFFWFLPQAFSLQA